MQMRTCANCSRPMRDAAAGEISFEQCPQCGGAWFEEGQFEALLGSREQSDRTSRDGSHQDHDSIEGLLPARQLRTLLKVGAAAAVALALIVGLAGYYVVWPLLTRTAASGTLTRIGSEVVGKPLAAPADVGTWAQQTAKKTAEDALRKAVGLPAKEAAAETTAEAPEAAETEK